LAEVLLSLGSNMGDPFALICAALDRLAAGGVRITARSHWYRTAPWGNVAQPDFINVCVAGETAFAPRALLDLIQATEAALGRERGERWGPRVIDIDMLTYGDESIDEPDLNIPHPHLTERAFVLVPLLDIAPDRLITGRRVRDWAASVNGSGVERVEPNRP
jgi:2-amino-4-hydroxy-6-hydroxymethyldihydropteridine diphosphokinase